MATLVFFMSVFLVISIVFLFIHLMMGKMIRPARPDADKLTIYECGEPTIGSAWVQFDLRYYVIALLFVIFDVEVAFFFPWAVVFGKANELARADLDPKANRRIELSRQLQAPLPPLKADPGQGSPTAVASRPAIQANDARSFVWIAFVDILVFFGVLLVGFAYLWKRGDIDWVKTVAAERQAEPSQPAAVLPKPTPAGTLVGAGRG